MQIITINKRDASKNPENFNSGHFFTLCYFKNSGANGEWKLIDSNCGKTNHREINFIIFNKDNRNITKRFYAIAYTRDYSEVSLNGEKIDSIGAMNHIQQQAYRLCNKEDIKDIEVIKDCRSEI